jgi:hypothetical protein
MVWTRFLLTCHLSDPDTTNTDQTQATALTVTLGDSKDVATAIATPSDTLNAIPDGLLDPIITDIDDFSDFYNFDDAVLDKLQLDSGIGTHPSTRTVAQATLQLEDGRSARWHSKAQERMAKGLKRQAGTQEEAKSQQG